MTEGDGQHSRGDIYELMTNVRLDIRELKTEVMSIKDVGKKVDTVSKVADDAEHKATVAHKRLDSIEDSLKWQWRTIGAGLILGVIGLFFKMKGGI